MVFHLKKGVPYFFPRASDRRVLVVVEVGYTFSYLHIFTSYHLQTFLSSHLLIFTSSHLHVFSSSHLHIFSSSHLLITSSHLALLPSCSLAHLPSCLLALLPSSLSPSFLYFSLKAAGAVPTRRHEMQPVRTKRGSIVKT